jgi:hypothetical protein
MLYYKLCTTTPKKRKTVNNEKKEVMTKKKEIEKLYMTKIEKNRNMEIIIIIIITDYKNTKWIKIETWKQNT